ncbi:MAG: hypothetical protein IT534_14135 [Bauldia sp.]|nr:hypothetical protein [Bauldia sp.]
MSRPPRLRAVLVLHLFHEDVALELLRRVGRLDADVDVIATGPPPSRAVAAAVAELARAEWIATPNEGFDVAPFLAVLPLLERRGYDLVCKLHTKKGSSGFGRRWREAFLDALIGPDRMDGLIGSGAVVAETIEAFAATPDLAMVGPAGLWLSAAVNMTANADGVQRLGAVAFPERRLPPDWGFFAGTMFWTRVHHLKPFVRLHSLRDAWEGEGPRRDGGAAHAVERLFGLVPVVSGGSVGLRAEHGGPLRITAEGGARVEILTALARLGRPDPKSPLDRAEAAYVRRHNPLLDYIATGGVANDPHPLFATEWYAGANAVPAGTTPLAHFLGLGAMAPDPSPLFPAAGYVRRRPWLKRRDENALLHHLRALDAGGSGGRGDPVAPPRPHTLPTDPFARVARRAQLAAFLRGTTTLSFAVKIGASRQSPSEWGDVHFAAGLARALESSGSAARVDYREDWYRRFDPPDVTIALRGPVRYEPRPESLNILWIISHPDQVSFAEMEAYDLVHVASDSFAMLLRQWVDVPVLGLLQATDASRFAPSLAPVPTGGLFFAGNSRGQDRPVVRWAIELGLPLEIHGFGWSDRVSPRILRGERIANAELPARYGAATAVIGDHWPAMADFGFVSNRIFDVLASGGTPITDAFPAIARAVGRAAITVEAREGLTAAVAAAAARPRAKRLAHAAAIRRDHGFSDRAATIRRDIAAFPTGAFVRRPARRGPRVHVVADPGDARAAWMMARRLLGPLTTDHAGLRSLSIGAPADPLPPADVVIAMPGPATRAGAWERVIAVAASGRLVVDAGTIGAPARLPARLKPLFAAAGAVWWPDARHAAGRKGQHCVLPDAVDPRLWRDYHRASRWDFASVPFRCVVVAPEGIDAALAPTLAPAFAGDHADLTIVGTPPSVPGPWTTVPLPAGKSRFAAYARWLRDQPFHAGLCVPGPAGARDAELAFLDFSAAGLLSLAPPALFADAGIEARALVVPLAADLSDLAATVDGLAAAPSRYAGLAAASSDYVFAARSAAAAGTIVRDLLDRVLSGSDS